MPVPMPHYAKIKNRYCVCYFGNCNEYVVQLINLKPYIEKQLPGIELYLCFKKELSHLVNGQDRILYQNEITDKRRDFAHIKMLKCNMKDHPVMQLFVESNLTIPFFNSNSQTKKCVIYPKGTFPTASLTLNDIDKLKRQCMSQGYEVRIEGDLKDIGWVIGVENEQLFQAGFKGIRTSLVPTGIGTEFYKELFKGEILTL